MNYNCLAEKIKNRCSVPSYEEVNEEKKNTFSPCEDETFELYYLIVLQVIKKTANDIKNFGEFYKTENYLFAKRGDISTRANCYNCSSCNIQNTIFDTVLSCDRFPELYRTLSYNSVDAKNRVFDKNLLNKLFFEHPYSVVFSEVRKEYSDMADYYMTFTSDSDSLLSLITVLHDEDMLNEEEIREELINSYKQEMDEPPYKRFIKKHKNKFGHHFN